MNFSLFLNVFAVKLHKFIKDVCSASFANQCDNTVNIYDIALIFTYHNNIILTTTATQHLLKRLVRHHGTVICWHVSFVQTSEAILFLVALCATV